MSERGAKVPFNDVAITRRVAQSYMNEVNSLSHTAYVAPGVSCFRRLARARQAAGGRAFSGMQRLTVVTLAPSTRSPLSGRAIFALHSDSVSPRAIMMGCGAPARVAMTTNAYMIPKQKIGPRGSGRSRDRQLHKSRNIAPSHRLSLHKAHGLPVDSCRGYQLLQ